MSDDPFTAWLTRVRPSWHRDAACAEHPTVTFFPTRGEDIRPALAVCAGCLVRSECLAHALEHDEHHGIWGGTSERQRRRLRRAATGVARAPLPRPPGSSRAGRRLVGDSGPSAEGVA